MRKYYDKNGNYCVETDGDWDDIPEWEKVDRILEANEELEQYENPSEKMTLEEVMSGFVIES